MAQLASWRTERLYGYPAARTRKVLGDVAIGDLGRARQVWATSDSFSILGGRGDRAAIRLRIGAAKAELRALAADEERARRGIRERIGKLAGTAAILYVGAPTESAAPSVGSSMPFPCRSSDTGRSHRVQASKIVRHNP